MCLLLCLVFFSEYGFAFLPFLGEEQEGNQSSGDGSAEVSLPADMGGEGIKDVADDRMEGIEHVKDLPACKDAVEEVGCHQAPDGAAGTGMEGVAAYEVDEQSGTKHGDQVDGQVLPSADAVFEDKAVGQQGIHVADEVWEAQMQETAQDDPAILSLLEGTLVHAKVAENVIFSPGQLVDACQGIQEHQDQGDPGQPDGMSQDPDACFLFLRGTVNQITGILPAVGADLGTLLQRHAAFLASDDY